MLQWPATVFLAHKLQYSYGSCFAMQMKFDQQQVLLYIFGDLVKCGVLTLVGEIPHCRNDHYFHHYHYTVYTGLCVSLSVAGLQQELCQDAWRSSGETGRFAAGHYVGSSHSGQFQQEQWLVDIGENILQYTVRNIRDFLCKDNVNICVNCCWFFFYEQCSSSECSSQDCCWRDDKLYSLII